MKDNLWNRCSFMSPMGTPIGTLMSPVPSDQKYFYIYMHRVFSNVKIELKGFILPQIEPV